MKHIHKMNFIWLKYFGIFIKQVMMSECDFAPLLSGVWESLLKLLNEGNFYEAHSCSVFGTFINKVMIE